MAAREQQTAHAPDQVDFVYPPLDLHSKQIRLLSKRDTTSLKYSLRTGIIAEEEYVALSYVWGTDEPTHQVDIDGKVLPVRRNLYDFLARYSQKLSVTSSTWIDSVCIDQKNTDERNHQVRQMLDIYKSAKYIIIWLGDADKSTRALIGLLAKFRGFSMKSFLFGLTPEQRLELLKFFEGFCNHQYWSRLWIVPEVLAAREIHIWCGESVLTGWQYLLDVANELMQYSQLPQFSSQYNLMRGWYAEAESKVVIKCRNEIAASIDAISRAMFLEFRKIKASIALDFDYSYDFDTLVRAYGRNACLDPRDRILALRALCNQPETIDYNLGKFDLFVDTLEPHSHVREQVQSQMTSGTIFDEITAYGCFVKEILSIDPEEVNWNRGSFDVDSDQTSTWNLIKQATKYTDAADLVVGGMRYELFQVMGLFDIETCKLTASLSAHLRKDFPSMDLRERLSDRCGYALCCLSLLFSEYSVAYTQSLALQLATGPKMGPAQLDQYASRLTRCRLVADGGILMRLAGVSVTCLYLAQGQVELCCKAVYHADPIFLSLHQKGRFTTNTRTDGYHLVSVSMEPSSENPRRDRERYGNAPGDIFFELPCSKAHLETDIEVYIHHFASVAWFKTHLNWVVSYSDSFDRLEIGFRELYS